MPYKDPIKREACRKRWRENHPEQTKAIRKRYKESIKVTKRCPACLKHFKIRRDRKGRRCPECRNKLSVSRTLGNNKKSDNRHGIRIWVILEDK